jgi:hypothetical protein
VSNVVKLNCITKLPIPPNDVLTGAIDKLDYVLVLGYGKDGKMWVATSEGKIDTAVYIASKFIHKEMNGDFF